MAPVAPEHHGSRTGFADAEVLEMAAELPKWAVILSTYLADSESERCSELAEGLMRDIEKQAENLRTQQQRGRMKRIMDSEQDMEELRQCYGQIENSFRQLQTDASLSTWKIADDHLKTARLNGMSPAHEARYDSSFSVEIERGGCLQNTRTTVLEDARRWIYCPSDARIYWMNGMAGTGKTTIAYSICAELERNRRLGASFFCSRASSECQDANRLLPTIAYQLAQQFYPFRSTLCRILGREASISQRNILVQFEHLIRAPLIEVENLMPGGMVVVIDALDECSNPRATELMLDTLLRHAADLPVRFFLTGRPEPSIINTIMRLDVASRSVLHLHNVEEQLVKSDIETYLTFTLAKLSLTSAQIKQLAEQAGILFIYAATVARYILATRPGADPSARLKTVLTGDATNQGSKRIDQLYSNILGGVLEDGELEEEEVELIKRVLWTVVCVREPVSKNSLAALLDVSREQVVAALQPLQSVLHISEGTGVVSTLHASFSDFMLSSTRSGRSICCNETAYNKYLAIRSFELMKKQLRFNICDLETSYRFDKDVPDIEVRVNTISPHLLYACEYWSEHLCRTEICDELVSYLDEFLRDRLLFWMEVLNLKKWMGDGPKILAEAQKWLLAGDTMSQTREFVHDARSFVNVFAVNPVRWSTPHIYLSALPLVSRQSKVWESYWRRTQGLLQAGGTVMRQRDGAPLAVLKVGSLVEAMAFSPDSTRIVSGSYDNKIRLWDVHSGAPLANPFKGHTGCVTSVAFSPDGTRIISGSDDRTVRLWDAHKGTPLANPFRGHTDRVTSVAFSPDGTRIVSSSYDRTIRLWDARSGISLVSPLRGHTGCVMSIAVSSDDTCIVSGSDDRTIRLWDAHNGAPLSNPLEGHTRGVTSVAFSPDGTRIVSGSYDQTIRLWDARSGIPLANPLKGHTHCVMSVAFSPDSNYIVSGSDDHTIWLWDLHNGAPVTSPFKGHTDCVRSVAFSPDGTRIISGSYDNTIRIWDAQSGTPPANPFEGHSDGIISVAFSPDGTQIASGSDDCTIWLWDAHNGFPLTSFKGHNSFVRSIAFSPDGTRIASGSEDCTIRLWDTSGRSLENPFKGHTRGIVSVAFSPDGTLIASGSDDSTIRLWDAHDGTPLANPFEGHVGWVMSIAFSPDGTCIVSGSYDCTVRLWDVLRGIRLPSPLIGHNACVTSVAFAPDGARIVSGSADHMIRLWNVGSATPLVHLFKGHTDRVTSAVFSPDGTRIASGSRDRTIRLWDAQNGTLLASPFRGHTQWVTSVAFSPDGARIVSGSYDCTVRVWEILDKHHPLAPIHNTCVIDRNGWLMDSVSRSLLLWLPVELRNSFPPPPNTLIIRPEDSGSASWDTVLLGPSWQQCYKPSPPSLSATLS